ncbi:class I SAM-dependent methyltransferase [Magnetofaba australis]|uniref:Putative methyl transferase n=1 Tax=Magnetofaba australis IT-1 TaxID=1434232 RepID=A0A1Y2KAB8_9PROT|nr:class I SAM-dependent methyltransferase [Magnetofaba australis]OSM06864.1 putative methyl transferase [Magnetofaba australis IT-1]
MSQAKQSEWSEQWTLFQDEEAFLFNEWIQPYALEDLRGKSVLECGCGGGQHTGFMAPYAASVTAVDLNTTQIARERNAQFNNIEFVEADIAAMDLGRQFDVVISIGVVHHTDDPDATVANLKRHVKPGGLLILWVYSAEGNAMVKYGVEPVRKLLLTPLSRPALMRVSQIVTALMYPFIYTIYLLPLRFLPFYAYFGNFRKLGFARNVLNVFDKLNAPQVDFISRPRAQGWVADMDKATVLPYMGVSHSVSGVRRDG